MRSRLGDDIGSDNALPDDGSLAMSTVADSCDEPCDDIGPMDSVSHAAGCKGSDDMESERLHVQDKLADLEKTFASKHAEVLSQMRMLQEKNELLEKQVEATRQGTGGELDVTPTRSGTTPLAASSNAKELSLLSIDDPLSKSSARRYSLLSIDPRDARSSTGGKSRQPRNSVREDNLQQDAQRRLWAEQRQFLLQDLYGEHGGPCAGGRGTYRRLSTAGLREPREVPRNLETTFEEASSSESQSRKPSVVAAGRGK